MHDSKIFSEEKEEISLDSDKEADDMEEKAISFR